MIILISGCNSSIQESPADSNNPETSVPNNQNDAAETSEEVSQEIPKEPELSHQIELIEVESLQNKLDYVVDGFYADETTLYKLTSDKDSLGFEKVLSSEELNNIGIIQIMYVNDIYYILQDGRLYESSNGNFELIKFDNSLADGEEVIAISLFDQSHYSEFDNALLVNTNLGRTFQIGYIVGINETRDSSLTYNNARDVSDFYEIQEGEYFIKSIGNWDDFFSLTNLGNVYLWGVNSYARLGNGTSSEIKRPLRSESFTTLENNEKIVDFEVTFMNIIYRTNFMNYYATGGLNNILDMTIFTVTTFPMRFPNPYKLDFNNQVKDYFETGELRSGNRRRFAELDDGTKIYWGQSLELSDEQISANEYVELFDFLKAEDEVSMIFLVGEFLVVDTLTSIYFLSNSDPIESLEYKQVDKIVIESRSLPPVSITLNESYSNQRFFDDYSDYIISSDRSFSRVLTPNDDLTEISTLYIKKAQ
jgi:hypothetical protein